MHLEPIGEKPNLDVAAPHVAAVVAVRDRVDSGFPNPRAGVLGNVATQQPVDRAAVAMRPSRSARRVDHVDDRPIELPVVEEALAARRLLRLIDAGVLQERDHQLRLELCG